MNGSIKEWLLEHTEAQALVEAEVVRELWGGFGELLRLHFSGGPRPTVILKRISPPDNARYSLSGRRKLRSYEVEKAWYLGPSRECDEHCRVAHCLGTLKEGASQYLLLEDLNQAGFYPCPQPKFEDTLGGLRWLAHFHAKFLDSVPKGLWEQGCYWHLDTRQQEWEKMPEGPWKDYARTFDQALQSARFQTLLHGDAKTPNFCWSRDHRAAAVDFQYTGRGCGIRDVALFLDRSLSRDGRGEAESQWLNRYFTFLGEALEKEGRAELWGPVSQEWRPLFSVAWSDYVRFALGWAEHVQIDSYSQRQLERALELLDT